MAETQGRNQNTLCYNVLKDCRMKLTMTTTTLSLRVSEELREELARLAKATDRPMNYHASAALEAYLAVQQWQVQGIQDAIAEADRDGACVEQEKIREWVESWDTEGEANPPL